MLNLVDRNGNVRNLCFSQILKIYLHFTRSIFLSIQLDIVTLMDFWVLELFEFDELTDQRCPLLQPYWYVLEYGTLQTMLVQSVFIFLCDFTILGGFNCFIEDEVAINETVILLHDSLILLSHCKL